MYRIALFLFLIGTACSDGDFEVPSFDFDSQVNVCGNYVLYRTNSAKTEALILLLDTANIPNENGEKEIAITKDNVRYRIFSDSFTSDYFCADIPPTVPVVLEEWSAVSAPENKIMISTIAILDVDSNTITAYEHHIVLYNLVLLNREDRITYEVYDFGTFKTVLSKNNEFLQ